MVPASDDDEDAQHDVKDEEELILRRAHVQPAADGEQDRRDGGHGAPGPPHCLCLLSVGLQADDGVDDNVERKDAGDPAVQQEVGRVRPVGQPEQDVVSQREEKEDGEEHEAKGAGAVQHVGRNLSPLAVEPPIRLR